MDGVWCGIWCLSISSSWTLPRNLLLSTGELQPTIWETLTCKVSSFKFHFQPPLGEDWWVGVITSCQGFLAFLTCRELAANLVWHSCRGCGERTRRVVRAMQQLKNVMASWLMVPSDVVATTLISQGLKVCEGRLISCNLDLDWDVWRCLWDSA